MKVVKKFDLTEEEINALKITVDILEGVLDNIVCDEEMSDYENSELICNVLRVCDEF